MTQNIVQWAGQQAGKTMGDALSLSSNGKFGRADLDANNNINAYSTSHALAIASAMQHAASTKTIYLGTSITRAQIEAFAGALHSGAVTGEKLSISAAEVVAESAPRQSIMERLLNEVTVGNGEPFRVAMTKQTVRATVAISASEIRYQDPATPLEYLKPFPIVAKAEKSNQDIVTSPIDAVEDMFNQVAQAGITAQDRLTINMLRAVARGGENIETITYGSLTPRLLAETVNAILTQGLPAGALLLSSNLWAHIIGESSFHSMFDAVTQHELLLTGQIATIFGFPIITDGFRPPELKVMDASEMLAVSSKEYLGAFGSHGPWKPVDYDKSVIGEDKRGVYATRYMYMAMPNSRAVKRTLLR